MNLKYTLRFIRAGDHLLMLNRKKLPNMGLWNGVGGRIEKGETPLQCIIREAEEEAGWEIKPHFAGLVTWEGAPETGTEGMYVFVTDVPKCMADTSVAERQDEGILAFLPITWVMNPGNLGVVDNIPYFLPAMLNGAEPMEWHCMYKGGRLADVEARPLTIDLEGVA